MQESISEILLFLMLVVYKSLFAQLLEVVNWLLNNLELCKKIKVPPVKTQRHHSSLLGDWGASLELNPSWCGRLQAARIQFWPLTAMRFPQGRCHWIMSLNYMSLNGSWFCKTMDGSHNNSNCLPPKQKWLKSLRGKPCAHNFRSEFLVLCSSFNNTSLPQKTWTKVW